MGTPEPTQDEILGWLAELATEEEENEPGIFTRFDWQEKFQCSDKKALKTIKKLIKAGAVETCWTRRQNVHGIWQPRPAYRYIGNETLAES